jgi:hypothetical protein
MQIVTQYMHYTYIIITHVTYITSEKSERSCIMGVGFACFYYIGFWNCSDSVVIFVIRFIYNDNSMLSTTTLFGHCIIITYCPFLTATYYVQHSKKAWFGDTFCVYMHILLLEHFDRLFKTQIYNQPLSKQRFKASKILIYWVLIYCSSAILYVLIFRWPFKG